jgi:outer membrane protein TolC
MTDGWLAQLSVSWPNAPWSRKGVDARIAEATATVEAREADAIARELEIRVALSDAYAKVKAAEERAALLRTALLPQSQQSVEVSRVSYQTDRADVRTVLENERTLLDAQLMYSRALTEWRQAVAALERAVGAPLPASMFMPASTMEVVR